MSKHLQRDLERLERDVLAQSSTVEQMIRTALRALVDRRPEMLEELDTHEQTVNEREVRIEEECLKALALHQPVAVDLRRVATVLKVNGDLERIADLAVNIGERCVALDAHPSLAIPETVEEMADVAIAMVRNALDALVDLDVKIANAVCDKDDVVDDCNRTVIGELTTIMREQPESVDAALHVFSASRQIERIADHATNIAEDVIYLVEGEITRHAPPPITPDTPRATDQPSY